MSSRAWHAAPCLLTLKAQLNAAYPFRSTKSDGMIGDEAHAKTKSEHNPDPGTGTVRAFDITHDPAHGPDGTQLVSQLLRSRDSRILYVIWNGRIWRSYAKPGIPAWASAAYTGADRHTNHVHLSVTVAGATSTRPWQIATPQKEDSMPTPQELIAAPLGTNPSSKKPSTLGEQLRIAGNYSFLNYKELVSQRAQLGALTAAVRALADARDGVDSDELIAAVTAAVDAGVDKALADVELTLSVDDRQEGAS